MSKRKPFFLTGANAKIKLNGKTIAFATDISYKIEVKHASPRVLGRFEVETHQPLSYDVSGSFTIIRYTKDLKDVIGGTTPNGVSGDGNGAGSWGLHSGVGGALAGAIGLPTPDGQFDGRADEAFVPSRFFQSKMFDIEIVQKVPPNTQGNNGALFEVGGGFIGTLLGVNPAVGGECAVAKLQDCRITFAEFVLGKRQVAKQKFNFVARYAHEDTFLARKSGVGQELS